MIDRILGSWGRVLGVLTMACLAGCGADDQKKEEIQGSNGDAVAHAEGDQDDHQDPDAPQTYAEGVAALKESYQTIQDAFAAGDAEKAHGPLHEVGDLLTALPKLAQSAGMNQEQVQSVEEASNAMFEAYGQVDSAMHHGEEPDYAAVADTLDQHMATLEQLQSDKP
jgi:hypothetical protein